MSELEKIAAALLNTLGPNTESIREGESTLDSMSSDPNFARSLLSIVMAPLA